MRTLYDSMHREIDSINSVAMPSDDELDARCGRVFETRDQLSEAPAQTLADVAIKLRELEYVIQEWGLDTQWHEPLMRTAREGLERLIGHQGWHMH
jgi:hypothetical protein